MKITPEQAALKAWSARECQNLMNKYEWLLGHSQFEAVMNLFATNRDDVRVELPFGKWVGKASLERCFLNLHKFMQCDEDGKPKPGTYLFNYNVNPIIEVADDLKTAKGLFPAPGDAMLQGPDGKFKTNCGIALRTADFIYNEEEDRWTIWHYVVTGITSHPFGVAPTDNTVNVHTSKARPYIFTEDRHPDAEPDHEWMYSTDRLIEYADYNRTPEPYATWDETFSY